MSNIPTSPYDGKTAVQISNELQEQIIAGIETVNHEEYTYTAGNDTYTILCGSPDIDNGDLIEIIRIYGTQNGSYKQFTELTDFTIDIANNQITFVTTPDDNTNFYVSYRYDNKKISGITDMRPGSVARTIVDSVAQQLSALYRSLDLLKAAMYIESATGEDLDELLSLVSTVRKDATPSTGYVSFYRDVSSGTSTITQGTVVAGAIKNGEVYYVTTEEAYIVPGFTSVRVPIQAAEDFYGTIGNIAAGKITKIISSGAGASRVNNPAYYTDYEYLALLDGVYGYNMEHSPRRKINTNTFPWLETDKGIIIVSNSKDVSISTANWTTSNVSISENTPQDGHSSCDPTSSGDYIQRNFEIDLATYPDVYMVLRGTDQDEFEVQINETTVSMYQFGSTTSTSSPQVTQNMALYVGSHGLTSTSISTFKIIFNSANTFVIDLVGIGSHLKEIPSYITATSECLINYTAKRIDLYYEDETSNFFETFDGDPSDGEVDQLFVYYQWNNYISGGGDRETDDEYRDRGRYALDVAAKGTKDAIRNAVLGIDGINQCEVTDYNDDPNIDPGVCHVYVLAQGYTVSPALEQDIVDTVNDVRAAGVHVKVFSPQVRYVNFLLNVVYDDANPDYLGTSGQDYLKELIISAISDFFANANINEALYFSDLIAFIIQEVEGVYAIYVEWIVDNTPTYSDDNFESGYSYSSSVILNNPQRITGQKTGVTLVVQAGNNIDASAITLLRKSDYR